MMFIYCECDDRFLTCGGNPSQGQVAPGDELLAMVQLLGTLLRHG